ncbi:MAG: DUF1993 family protein [Proteobacteria bacterium]|nr:DUF1993 family protein [Pseudomonadota bacterium]
MTISMYESLVPTAIHNLQNLSAILSKGLAYAEAKKIDEKVLFNARLFPDMLPLSRQVQIACDSAKAGAARLAEIEVPSHPDEEQTFAELKTRIQKTVDFLNTIKPEQINGKEDLKITYTQRNRESNFIGLPYLLNYTLPNIYFHITTAYAILRHNGVEIGKKDYLGNK